MDLGLSRNRGIISQDLTQPHVLRRASQSSSSRSSIFTEDATDIDHTAIPRRPGSSRFRVLPNISAADAGSGENSDGQRTTDPELKLSKDPKIVASVDAKKFRRGEDSVKSKSTEAKDGAAQGKSVPRGSNLTARLSPKVKEGSKAADAAVCGLTSSERAKAFNGDRVDPKTKTISSPTQITAGKKQQSGDQTTARKAAVLLPPPEPGSGEKSVSLAVKLPTGERLQRRFHPSDPLQSILQLARSSSHVSDRCELVCVELKTVFGDMRKTIEQCKIPDKTLLYVQLPEPE